MSNSPSVSLFNIASTLIHIFADLSIFLTIVCWAPILWQQQSRTWCWYRRVQIKLTVTVLLWLSHLSVIKRLSKTYIRVVDQQYIAQCATYQQSSFVSAGCDAESAWCQALKHGKCTNLKKKTLLHSASRPRISIIKYCQTKARLSLTKPRDVSRHSNLQKFKTGLTNMIYRLLL